MPSDPAVLAELRAPSGPLSAGPRGVLATVLADDPRIILGLRKSLAARLEYHDPARPRDGRLVERIFGDWRQADLELLGVLDSVARERAAAMAPAGDRRRRPRTVLADEAGGPGVGR